MSEETKKVYKSGFSFCVYQLENYKDRVLPKIKITTAKTMKIKNKILAICMAEPAIPVNPNNAATIAITKNITAQFNIHSLLLSLDYTIPP
jgi:hypothetical protein